MTRFTPESTMFGDGPYADFRPDHLMYPGSLHYQISYGNDVSRQSIKNSAGFHVTQTAQQTIQKKDMVCKRSYPDPNHHMRRAIKAVVTHSNRVTAAVYLKFLGLHNDEIAHKLRWDPSSVPTCLRDCWQDIGERIKTALRQVLDNMQFSFFSAFSGCFFFLS